MLHPVVLSGGSGSRLWPLSRENQPKQFLSLIGDRSLFQETVLRARALPQAGLPVTVCAEGHRFMVGEQLQGIGVDSGGILLEPMARNTAPAIALAACHLLASDPEAVMLVLPADHLIEDESAFREAVARAAQRAAEGWLVTFGIQPDYPETGYGYIARGEALDEGVYRVARFVEKPALATAQAYLAEGTYAWNSGMFLFQAAR
ncbi:mannose-1-phosphate guanylyltransferase, partial [Pseudomonas sp. CGJS7]|uniref:mannose-1-phosphate guanylyltransferase n=1 Tax=Pseudomonas sp. CGJS7 TaxID=3109348 RepID=UPI00300A0181